MITLIFLSMAIYCLGTGVISVIMAAAASQAKAEAVKNASNMAGAVHLLGLIAALTAAGIAALWGI